METVPEGYKRCSGDERFSCGQVKPVSEFYEKREGQYQSLCKPCFNARRKARYAANPETENEQARKWQEAHPESVAEAQRKYKVANQDKIRENNREAEASARKRGVRAKYRAEHADERLAYRQAYNATHREQIRESNRRYREQNGPVLSERQRKWREEHPESYSEIHARWKRDNTDAVNASTHRRRATIKGNGGSWTAAEWRALRARYDHRCLMCGEQKPLTFDHVIPLKLGGPNVVANGQPLCKVCNSKKHVGVLDLRPGSVYDQHPEWPVGIAVVLS